MRSEQLPIPTRDPLRLLFQDLVSRHVTGDVHLRDPEIAQYLSSLLTDFMRTGVLFRIRDASGRRLEEVAEMLVESNPLLDASSFDREREVRKHVGDFTLFFSGMFPEAVSSMPKLRPLARDALLDYMAVGKESYAIVAAFNVFDYRREAPLFRRLSDQFELCVLGLNLVREELDHLQATRPPGTGGWAAAEC